MAGGTGLTGRCGKICIKKQFFAQLLFGCQFELLCPNGKKDNGNNQHKKYDVFTFFHFDTFFHHFVFIIRYLRTLVLPPIPDGRGEL
jgi:hypothetical protein